MAGIVLALAAVGSAAPGAVELTVQPHDVGLLGNMRPGSWTPIRLTLESRLDRARAVVCQWVLPDADGDQVYAQRTVTLNPGRRQRVWLYGTPPASTRPSEGWLVRVVDEATAGELAQVVVSAPRWLNRLSRAVAVTGALPLGLQAYSQPPDSQWSEHTVTHNETTRLIAGIEPANLPDRWWGLSTLESLVWTPQGGDPAATGVTPQTHDAIRQWVRRGGHLVVVLPAVGQTWTSSPLADLLPPVTMTTLHDALPPDWLGTPANRSELAMQVTALEPQYGGPVATLLRDANRRPLVVAWRAGFGRVTLIGVDLTDPRLARLGLPNGSGLWSAVFGWRGPVLPREFIEQEIAANRMSRPSQRMHVQLDRFLPRGITMHQSATPALVAAIIFFIVYWFAAGPITYALLRDRKRVQHSWSVFAATAALFTMAGWGGAYALRTATPRITHLSVLDIDAADGTARVRSWLSVFVPKHGEIPVRLSDIGDGEPSTANATRDSGTIASPGLDPAQQTNFLDTRRYTLNIAAPGRLTLPIRATAKQLDIQYFGPLTSIANASDTGPTDRWQGPTGEVHVVNGWPAGQLVHYLPGTLRNLRVIYCPGDGVTPWVWQHEKHKHWPAGQALIVTPPRHADRLVRRAARSDDGRVWDAEGYLGRLIAAKTGRGWGGTTPTFSQQQNTGQAQSGSPPGPTNTPAQPAKPLVQVADNEIAQAVEMLSFFNALPEPAFLETDMLKRPANYRRSVGRDLDLTSLTVTPCLILIGYMDSSPLPAPLKVDGKFIGSEGLTVVRWIAPLHDPPRTPRAKRQPNG